MNKIKCKCGSIINKKNYGHLNTDIHIEFRRTLKIAVLFKKQWAIDKLNDKYNYTLLNNEEENKLFNCFINIQKNHINFMYNK
jgi:hypothetical protein